MVYSILVPTILFLPILTNKLTFGKKLYFFVVTGLLIYFAGFRHYTVGVDSPSYVMNFLEIPPLDNLTSKDLSEVSEPLYLLLCSTIRYFTNDYFWLFFIVAVFYTTVIATFIYKYSAYPFISFLTFLSMSYYAFSMTGIRQTICYGFLMLATHAILSRKRMLALLFIVISAGFHTTGWLFLSAIVIDILPFGLAFLCGVFFACVIAFALSSTFIGFFLNLLEKSDSYLNVRTGSTTILMVVVVVAFAAILMHPDIFKKGHTELKPNGKTANSELLIDQFFMKMILFSIPILVVTLFQANIFRIAAMFHVVMIAFIPTVIKKQTDPYVQLLGKLIVCAALLAELYLFTYNAAHIFPYRFS